MCPNPECRIQFTREMIATSFPSLLKVFKTMREKYLLDSEKSRLPEAQTYIEVMRIHENFSGLVSSLNKRARELEEEAQRIRREIETHYAITSLLKHKAFRAALESHERGFVQGKNREKFVSSVMCPCHVAGCRGYITVKSDNGEKGVCGVCGVEICKLCMAPITEQHECKPDDVATTKELKKNSRPCPKCAAPISKIDGCDQMWCVLCHTAFSWNTGELAKGVIHNPHFFAYQRQVSKNGDIPRVQGDVAVEDCGNNFVHIKRDYYLQEYFELRDGDNNYLWAFVQFSRHFSGTMYRTITERRAPDNIDLRVCFLNNDIDEEEFGRLVQQRDKKYQKELEIDAALLIFFDTGNRMVNDIYTITPETVVVQLKNLVSISNTRFDEISKIYKNKVKQITYKYDKVVKDDVMKLE